MKIMLKQLSNDVPTMNRDKVKVQKLLVKAVAMEAKNPTPLQATSAGKRP